MSNLTGPSVILLAIGIIFISSLSPQYTTSSIHNTQSFTTTRPTYLSLPPTPSADETIQLSSLAIPVVPPPAYPTSSSDFLEIFLYMAATSQRSYTFEYNTEMAKMMQSNTLSTFYHEAFDKAFSLYPEYFCYRNNLSVSIEGSKNNGSMTFAFDCSYFSGSNDQTLLNPREARDTFFEQAPQIIQSLIDSGEITLQMSETEKAAVLYEWVVVNLEYDMDFNQESFTGYGALKNKKAVCQGYTALYNTLCKLVGIQIEGVNGVLKETNTKHMWSKANLDGATVYIDPTSADPLYSSAYDVDFSFFAIDAATLRKTHAW